MADVTVKTNRHWRNFCYRDDVPQAVLDAQFAHLTDDDGMLDGFIHYRDWWYHISDFMAVRGLTEPPMSEWDGYISDSFFSGVVIKLSRDGESYRIGTYMS